MNLDIVKSIYTGEPDKQTKEFVKTSKPKRTPSLNVTINGETNSLLYFSKKYNIPSSTLHTRYKKGARGVKLLQPMNNTRKGNKNHNAKLTHMLVQTIRDRIANGERVSDIAKEYGVTSGTISQIKHGRSWND